MPPLRFAKRAILRLVDFAGFNARIIDSAWRQRRLLIVCWHGISNDDEHAWNPNLFMPPETFRMRLELLREMKCNVLPLGEALSRLRTTTLPPRSVCITVDDGDSSFYLRAWPLLREFGFPSTLYWTTYYSTRPFAVFDPMLSYLLWKGRERTLALREPALRCQLYTSEERNHAFATVYETSKNEGWTADDKESFLLDLARLLEIDYPQLKSRRVLHLITPAEARSMVSEGLDLQLHTHRHRAPRNRDEFVAELVDNTSMLIESGAESPRHFCYPSGCHLPDFGPWLRDNGVESATTCESGLAESTADPFYLPRLIDHQGLSPSEFKSWLSGIAATMRRSHRMSQHGFR